MTHLRPLGIIDIVWLVGLLFVLMFIHGCQDGQIEAAEFRPRTGLYDYQQFVEREEDGK